MTIMYIFTVPTQHLKVVNKLTVHHMSLNIKMKRPAAYVHRISATVGYIIITMYIYHALMIP